MVRIRCFFGILSVAILGTPIARLAGQTVIAGTYTGATITGDISIASSTSATFTGGSSFTGTNASLGNSAGFIWQQTGTLAAKAITFGSSSYLGVWGVGSTLTLDSATTGTGDIRIYTDGNEGNAIVNQGALTHTGGTGHIYGRSVTNSGTITATGGTLYLGTTSTGWDTANSGTVVADGTNTAVLLQGNVTNTGTLRAQNSGQLHFQGSNASANLGPVQLASGGRALLDGTLDNTKSTLNAPSGGSFELYGGTINGGTVASGALAFTTSGGALEGVTFTGNLTLPQSTSVTLRNGSTFTGSAVELGNYTYLSWQQLGAMVNKAITFGTSSSYAIAGANNTLTFDAATTATGDIRIYTDGSDGTAFTNQGTITHTGGSGHIYGRSITNSGNLTATGGTFYFGTTSAGWDAANSGTLIADGANTAVLLQGNVTNTGTLRAQNSGKLYFQGTNSSANLGTIQLTTGGQALLNGTLTNGDRTLTAPTGGSFELYGGTISGGTVAAGTINFTSSSGYLEGVAYTGNLTLAASTGVTLSNGTTFSGSVLTLGPSASLGWHQAGTLANKTLSFGSNSYLYVQSTESTLTLDATTTGSGDIRIFTDGSNGTTINNAGTLTHTGGSGHIYGRTVINGGTITATAGSLYFGTTSAGWDATNSGTMISDGANTALLLQGNVTNTGTVRAQNSGQLHFQGTNTTANLGTVQLATGGRALLDGTLVNTSATLNAPGGGAFELYGGTISGGTIASGALAFTTSGGTLDGATYTGDLVLPASTSVTLRNGASFTGSALTLGNSSALGWQQAGTLASKTITFGSSSYLYVNGSESSVTLDAATTGSGDIRIFTDGSNGTSITNAGTLTHTGGTGHIYGRSIANSGNLTATGGTLYFGTSSTSYLAANSGTIVADGAGTAVILQGNLTNTGTLRAQNSGHLHFQGPNTTGNLGTVQLATGGRALIDGTLDNAAATLSAPSGGAFELYGGTIAGGTITAGALSFTTSGGALDGAALSGNVVLPSSGSVTLRNGATFTGAAVTLGSSSGLVWQQIGALANKTLTFGAGSYFYVNGTNNTLTFDSTTTGSGDIRIFSDGSDGTAFTNAGNLTHTGGSGHIYGRSILNSGNITATGGTFYFGTTSSSYNAANSGTIVADGTNTSVVVQGNLTNTGTLRAQNSGQLQMQGTNSTGNFGQVVIASGGRVLLNGTFANAGNTLNAPTGGSYELYGGGITGGTIASGALSFTSSGGSVTGATFSGNLTLPASSHVYFIDGTALNGPSLTLNANASLHWQQAGTLAGKTITLGDGAYVRLAGHDAQLTLSSHTTASGDLTLYSDLSSGAAIRNEGSLTHSSSNGHLYATSFTNHGTISATSGFLALGVTNTGTSFTNTSTGTIHVNGANVSLNSPATFVNQGTINVQSGTLFTNNALTNTAGSVLRGSGTVTGSVVLAGGTLAPGNSIGTLTLQSGTLNITSASVFAVELAGASSDQLVFQNPTSMINLGSGLLTLSLTLLGAPVDNSTYNLVRIASGGSGIAGAFANAPGSGSMVFGDFGGTTYGFTVNYATNLVSLTFTAVPEPSTYLLLAAGLVLIGVAARRRRS